MPIILSLFAPIQKFAYLYLEKVLKFHQSSFQPQCLFLQVLRQLWAKYYPSCRRAMLSHYFLLYPMHYQVALEPFGLLKVVPRHWPLGRRFCFHQHPTNLQLTLFPLCEEYTLCESKVLCCSFRYSRQLPVEEPLYGPLASPASFQRFFCTFEFHLQLLRQTFFLRLRRNSPSASPHKVQGHYFLLCHILCLRKTSTDVLPAQNLPHVVRRICQARRTSSRLPSL